MPEPNLLAAVDTLMSAYGITQLRGLHLRVGESTFRPDFVARTPQGQTAIEIRETVDARLLYGLFAWYDEARRRGLVERLLVVTPTPPSDAQVLRFRGMFDDASAQWIDLAALPAALGIQDVIDLTSSETLDHLQAKTLTRRTSEHRDAIAAMSPVPRPAAPPPDRVVAAPKVGTTLSRQLSPQRVLEVLRSGEPEEKALRIGEEVRPFVLLSDIVSFSTLVRVGDASLVQKMMASYYRLAREIVWSHGGTLDKFIGDAVLAIFGYPEATAHEASKAVRAAADLVQLGRELLARFQSSQNEAIESGTRIGIASGEVLVLNIGTDQTELSFVGNAINLAARLEASSVVDGILMDNRTYAGIAIDDPTLHGLIQAQERVLDPNDAKGQLTRIRAWQVSAAGLAQIRASAYGTDGTSGTNEGLRGALPVG